MFNVYIDNEGKIIKNIIINIHQYIKQLLYNKNEIEFIFYIVRIIDFIKIFKTDNTLSDLFNDYNKIKINLTNLLNFISIANEYVKVQLVQNQNHICKNCNYLLNENINSEYICDNCGLINNYKINNKEIDIQKQSYYSLKSNFIKAINNYQGINVIINEQDLDIIKNEINKRNISYNILNRDHIYKILKDLKMSKYYYNINIIMNKLINTPIRDISKLVPKLIELHTESEYIYSFVKNEKRVNSLNVNYKLYKLLILCNVDCELNELLKTDQKLDENEKKWQDICSLLKW